MNDLYMPCLMHPLPKDTYHATDSLWLAVKELQAIHDRARSARMREVASEVPRLETLDPTARIASLEGAVLSLLGLFEELNATKAAPRQEGGTETFRSTHGRPSFHWYARVHRILLDDAREIREKLGL